MGECGLILQPVHGHHCLEIREERRDHAVLVGVQGSAPNNEHVAVAQVVALAVFRSRRRGCSGTCFDDPSFMVGRQQRDCVATERGVDLLHNRLGRVGLDESVGERHDCVGLVAETQRFEPSPIGLLDECRHRAGRHDEGDEIRGVRAFRDRERSVRRDEIPVDGGRADERRDDRGREAADGCYRDDDTEIDQKAGTRRERSGMVRRDRGVARDERSHDRQRDRCDNEADGHTGSVMGRTNRCTTSRRRPLPLDAIGPDHVDVDLLRETQHVIDHRAAGQLRPA